MLTGSPSFIHSMTISEFSTVCCFAVVFGALLQFSDGRGGAPDGRRHWRPLSSRMQMQRDPVSMDGRCCRDWRRSVRGERSFSRALPSGAWMMDIDRIYGPAPRKLSFFLPVHHPSVDTLLYFIPLKNTKPVATCQDGDHARHSCVQLVRKAFTFYSSFTCTKVLSGISRWLPPVVWYSTDTMPRSTIQSRAQQTGLHTLIIQYVENQFYR